MNNIAQKRNGNYLAIHLYWNSNEKIVINKFGKGNLLQTFFSDFWMYAVSKKSFPDFICLL